MQVQATYEMGIEAVGGVTYDGESIWITYVDGDNCGLKRINKTTQVVDRHFPSDHFIAGLCFDGTDLWGNIKDRGICRIDAETGAVLETLPFPDEGFMSGLAWDGTWLWLGNHDKKRLYKIDRKTGAVKRTFDTDRFVTGIAWANDQLWHGAITGRDYENDNKQLRQINTETGETIKKFDYPHMVSGMAWDGSMFWCGDCVEGKIRRVDPGAATIS